MQNSVQKCIGRTAAENLFPIATAGDNVYDHSVQWTSHAQVDQTVGHRRFAVRREECVAEAWTITTFNHLQATIDQYAVHHSSYDWYGILEQAKPEHVALIPNWNSIAYRNDAVWSCDPICCWFAVVAKWFLVLFDRFGRCPLEFTNIVHNQIGARLDRIVPYTQWYPPFVLGQRKILEAQRSVLHWQSSHCSICCQCNSLGRFVIYYPWSLNKM